MSSSSAKAGQAVRISVTAADYNGLDVVLSIHIDHSGLPEAGNIDAISPPTLFGAGGFEGLASHWQANPSDPDGQTVVFSNVPESALKEMRVELDSIAFSTADKANGARRNVLDGPWSAEVRLAGVPSEAPRLVQASAAVPFGPGTLQVTEVRKGRDEIVIFGDYAGFSDGELQEVIGSLATLILSDGTVVKGTWYSHTTSSKGARFEMRFPPTNDASATLVVPFALSAGPAGAESPVTKALAAYVGMGSSVEVTRG